MALPMPGGTSLSHGCYGSAKPPASHTVLLRAFHFLKMHRHASHLDDTRRCPAAALPPQQHCPAPTPLPNLPLLSLSPPLPPTFLNAAHAAGSAPQLQGG